MPEKSQLEWDCECTCTWLGNIQERLHFVFLSFVSESKEMHSGCIIIVSGHVCDALCPCQQIRNLHHMFSTTCLILNKWAPFGVQVPLGAIPWSVQSLRQYRSIVRIEGNTRDLLTSARYNRSVPPYPVDHTPTQQSHPLNLKNLPPPLIPQHQAPPAPRLPNIRPQLIPRYIPPPERVHLRIRHSLTRSAIIACSCSLRQA